MYGIANCDTIKKARRWLQEQGVDYTFHDFKKEGVDEEALRRWCAAAGWEVLLNRRGTTWRKLSDADKADVDEAKAIRLLMANPSMIKRPVLEYDGQVMVGFSEAAYAEALA
jgi:Spx/MgsR family transcriptional regulator